MTEDEKYKLKDGVSALICEVDKLRDAMLIHYKYFDELCGSLREWDTPADPGKSMCAALLTEVDGTSLMKSLEKFREAHALAGVGSLLALERLKLIQNEMAQEKK